MASGNDMKFHNATYGGFLTLLKWTAPIVVLIASGSALVWTAAAVAMRGRTVLALRIPFGPFIAAAFWLCWFLQLAS